MFHSYQAAFTRILIIIAKTPPLFKGKKDAAPVSVPDTTAGDEKTKTATENYFTAKQEYQIAANKSVCIYLTLNDVQMLALLRGTDADKKAALDKLNNARSEMGKAMSAQDQDNIGRLNAQGQQAQDELFEQLSNNTQAEIDANNAKIKEYDDARKDLLKARMDKPLDVVAKDVGLPDAQPDPQAATAAPAAAAGSKPKAPDYWTSISVEVAASYEHSESTQKSQSTSAGASGGWGGFSAGGSMAYSKSSADAMSQMAKSSVKATFECMRVDIARPWLRADLFFDDDLQVSPGN